MTHNNGTENGAKPSVVATLLPKIMGMMFRLIPTYLRFRSKARKAEKIFVKELIAQGLERKRAEELGDLYMEPTHLFKASLGNGMKMMKGAH